ncbi:MAG: hybrid sensor histidine kinase/response regulator [Thioploca sp.]|nr:hybrid sensor histidine kinase/response regulator [Thioploca sp.]
MMIADTKVLIVDDNEANRNVLHDFVSAIGYTPILAENGFVALDYIQAQLPDLILLDILMPNMDGYEVLDNLKTRFTLRHTPVIMISAVEEMESVVRCIKLGADDYLVKPFNFTLLKARIGACLERKRLLDQEAKYRQQIENYNKTLEQRVQEKTHELAEAHERLKILDKSKGDFLKLISHELRTPLSGIMGLSEILLEHELDNQHYQEYKTLFKASLDRLLEIIKQALLLTQIEVSADIFPLVNNDLDSILDAAAELAFDFAQSRQVTLAPLPRCNANILSEAGLLTNALAALLKTAIKFSKPGNTVQVSNELQTSEIIITIAATGWTIPTEYLSQFFEVFSVGESITPGGDIGLGPPVAERIIHLFKGTVTVANREASGILFTVRLQLAESQHD